MRAGALVRRTLPYLVLAVIGFAIACAIVFLFILPPVHAPATHDALAQDSSFIAPEIPDTPQFGAVPPQDTGMAPDTSIPADTPVVIPDVAEMALPDARTVLESLRLGVVLQYDTSSYQPENSVLRQLPPVGTLVDPGDTVTLVISHFPPLVDTTRRSVPPGAPAMP